MWPLLWTLLSLLLLTAKSISHSHSHSLLLPNQCKEKCGEIEIPFPFHLNSSSSSSSPSSSCHSLSNAFQLSCTNSTTLYLTIGNNSNKFRVLEFYSDGLLVDLSPSSSSSCRQYSDYLNFEGIKKSQYYGVSDENVIGLYDCEDSSACRAECEVVGAEELPGCSGDRKSGPGCCYPLSDHSVWRFGDGLSVFSRFGCRGFSSWAEGKRGVKLEWAVPRNRSSSLLCGTNGYVVNATSVQGGLRCLCQQGFVGDGFLLGNGCIKSCIKDRREVYGSECNDQNHKNNDSKLVIIGGVVCSAFIVASFAALFCLMKQQQQEAGNNNEPHFEADMSFQKACRPGGGATRLLAYRDLHFHKSRKLAQCSDGTALYSGSLSGGSPIAVHKLGCDVIDFSRIEALSSVAGLHRGIARVVGWCLDSPGRGGALVVYERARNGTLEENLPSLDWPTRLNIAAETAGVLTFLHDHTTPPIPHRDLSSGSVFLDEDFSVKIAGIGLTAAADKNDVCEMGMLLLQIVTGSSSSHSLALQKINKEKVEEVVDPGLYYEEQASYRREQIESVADLAARCLLFGGDSKIGMSDVSRELGHIIGRESLVHASSSKRGPALKETFSNSSLLQMISMSPDSIYNHLP